MTDASSPPAFAGTGQSSDSSGAQDKAQEMKGQAQEQAQNAMGKAQDTMREQLDTRSTEAGEKVAGTASDLRSVGEELRNQGKETPAKLADKAAERTEQVGSYLRDSDSDKLLEDIEDFGRRQPLAVLAGGMVVGMLAARFLKASSRNRYQSRYGSSSSQTVSSPREIQSRTPAYGGTPAAAPTATPPVATPQVPVPSDPALR
jgi:uncharacterized membrane-anchored protein YhcB (DUF1043 family)